MDGLLRHYTKRNEPERERQILYDNTYMWNLKYGTNEPVCKTETDSQTQRIDLEQGKGERGWERAI